MSAKWSPSVTPAPGRSGSSSRASSASDSSDEDRPAGALASDEALAALRDKLSGGQS